MNIGKALTKHNPMRGKAIAAYTVFGIPAAGAAVYAANRVDQSTLKGKAIIAAAGIGTMLALSVILESIAKMK